MLLFSVMAPVIIGLIALSYDSGRYMTLNTELQDLADAAALAGAKELDGQNATETRPSAIQRATAAATSLLANDPRFASVNDGMQILQPVFYETLGGGPTTDSTKAQFIKVTTVTRTMDVRLMQTVMAGPDANTSAQAVAGSTVVACKVPPLMICAPDNDVTLFNPVRGRLYRLKAGGGGSFVPGVMGVLDPPGMTNSGGNLTRDLLAASDPNFCFVSGVSAKTGNNAGPVENGINVRFDMYSNASGGGLKAFPPAPNITKGMMVKNPGKSNCSYEPAAVSDNAMGLPRGTPEPPDVPFGAGSVDWDRTGYWNKNHATKAKPSGWDAMTRWEVYLWELSLYSSSDLPYPQQMPSSPTKEVPTAQCYTDPVEPTTANRRAIYAAVVNCAGVTGNSVPVMPVNRYAKFFITEPASTNGDIFAEFVEMVIPGDNNGVLHHIVQLYR